jgi:hypothetical protein
MSASPECTVDLAGVHGQCSPGRMLDLVEPLPIENSGCVDDQATHGEHDSGTAVLSLRRGVDPGTPFSSRSVGQGATSVGLGSLDSNAPHAVQLAASASMPHAGNTATYLTL